VKRSAPCAHMHAHRGALRHAQYDEALGTRGVEHGVEVLHALLERAALVEEDQAGSACEACRNRMSGVVSSEPPLASTLDEVQARRLGAGRRLFRRGYASVSRRAPRCLVVVQGGYAARACARDRLPRRSRNARFTGSVELGLSHYRAADSS